jgi:hypothetical protein
LHRPSIQAFSAILPVSGAGAILLFVGSSTTTTHSSTEMIRARITGEGCALESPATGAAVGYSPGTMDDGEEEAACPHLAMIHKRVRPQSKGCEECLKMGDSWVHLRLCMHCGHVGCCDDSKNRHATKHFHATSHPIVRSLEPGETWGWCFVDQIGFDPLPEA